MVASRRMRPHKRFAQVCAMDGVGQIQREFQIETTPEAIVALGLLAAIGDIHRFPTPGKLAAYFGLVPSPYQSGDQCYHGRITKRGRS